MDTNLQKKQLRAELIAKYQSQTEQYCKAADTAITRHLLALFQYSTAKNVFCFVGIKKEVDTSGIICAALQSQKHVFAPRCLGNGTMEARRVISTKDLLPSHKGLLEPPKTAELILPDGINLVIVPALAFDRQGHRLGQGGGYYDRFLPLCKNAVTVGVVRTDFFVNSLPTQGHDTAVDLVVTQDGYFSVAGATIN